MMCLRIFGRWASLRGFTLTNGFTHTDYIEGDHGGGVLVEGEVRNCHITGNSAQGHGGGAYVFSYGTILTSRIYNNTADSGGGVSTYGSVGHESEAFLSECYIYDNTAQRDGGGIHCGNWSGRIEFCSIYHNTAMTNGGGVDFWGDYSAVGTLESCHIYGNSAGHDGGGFFFKGPGVWFGNCRHEVNDSIIEDNTATGDGGGAFKDYSHPLRQSNSTSGGGFQGAG